MIKTLMRVRPTKSVREGTPGRHEPPQCRHEPPRFVGQTKPPLGRASLRYTDRASAMQYTSLHHTAQLFLNLGFYV